MKKRILSTLMVLCLCLSLLPAVALATAPAVSDVPYYDWDSGQKKLVEKICPSAQVIPTSGPAYLGNAGEETWYVVEGTLTLPCSYSVTGHVHLILADGCTFTAPYGIHVGNSSNTSLTIYGQADGTGKLIAKGKSLFAGIGGGDHPQWSSGSGGTITVNGGVIEATGGWNAAGIGGGYAAETNNSGGTITINGGTVTAKGGGKYAAGLGGGPQGSGGTMTVNGGTVTATGGGDCAAGLGGGYQGSGGTITVNGGTVTAESGGKYAAGLGGGRQGDGGTITVRGGTVTAKSISDIASAIGGGYEGAGGTITMSGGTIIALSPKRGIGYGAGSFSAGTFTTTDTGTAIIKTMSIADQSNRASWRGILFEGDTGEVYGNQSLNADLTVDQEETLLVGEGVTLETNGKLNNTGTLYVGGTVDGAVAGTGAVYYGLTLQNCTLDGGTHPYQDKPYGEAGQEYRLTPVTAPGDTFDHWLTDPASVGVSAENQFTMPECALTVTAVSRTDDPAAVCTRAQALMLLWRAVGQPEAGAMDNPFSDVNEQDDCCKAVLWAVEQGITTGVTETTFAPGDPCTRAQVAAFLYRSAQANGSGLPGDAAGALPFADVPQWCYAAVAWCTQHGVIPGTGETTFSPNDDCTRGQVMTMLSRLLGES